MSAPLGIERIDASNLSERVLARVRDQIIGGALPSGKWLRLADLAHELGTSITPVRSALARLESQGLVEVAKARGYRVIPPTAADIADAYLIVRFLSGELGARAARMADTPFVERCRELAQTVERAASASPAEDIDAANWKFHRTINAQAGAPRLRRVLRTVTRSVPHDFHRIVPGWTPVAIDHHSELVEALAAGDAGRARAVAENHVALGCAQLLDHLARLQTGKVPT